MVNTEMKNAFNAFNTSEPMNWAPSKQNEAKKAHNEALKAAVKRSKAQANAEKAALRKKENEKAYREAVKRSKAQANAEKAARRKKEEANLKKAQEKAYKEAAKRSKDQANKARNERARVRAQKKEEENRKKKTNAERRASNASTNKNKSFWKTVLNKIKNSNMTEEQKLKEGKKVYKKAVFKLHPNKGGKKEDFQEFSNFYNKFRENPYPEIKPRKQPRNFGGHPF